MAIQMSNDQIAALGPDRDTVSRTAWVAWVVIALSAWAAVVASSGRGDEILAQWPVAVAMLLGSYFAGSTPLGGGVVGFPVLVLGFDFDASVGRDFSFAIQAVGMTSASIWILTARYPVAWRWLRPALIGAAISTPLGCMVLAPVLSDLGSKLTFAVLVGAYGLVQLSQRKELTEARARTDSAEGSDWKVGVPLGLMGGALSVACGSGSDVVIYIALMLYLGVELRCALYTSVILMAWTSILGILTQLSLGEVGVPVTDAWLAAAPVVLFGAPLGALVSAKIPRAFTLNLVTLLCLGQVIWFCLHEGLSLTAQLGVWLAVFVGFAVLLGGRRLQRRSRS